MVVTGWATVLPQDRALFAGAISEARRFVWTRQVDRAVSFAEAGSAAPAFSPNSGRDYRI